MNSLQHISGKSAELRLWGTSQYIQNILVIKNQFLSIILFLKETLAKRRRCDCFESDFKCQVIILTLTAWQWRWSCSVRIGTTSHNFIHFKSFLWQPDVCSGGICPQDHCKERLPLWQSAFHMVAVHYGANEIYKILCLQLTAAVTLSTKQWQPTWMQVYLEPSGKCSARWKGRLKERVFLNSGTMSKSCRVFEISWHSCHTWNTEHLSDIFHVT
jgi:hypothetical protein